MKWLFSLNYIYDVDVHMKYLPIVFKYLLLFKPLVGCLREMSGSHVGACPGVKLAPAVWMEQLTSLYVVSFVRI